MAKLERTQRSLRGRIAAACHPRLETVGGRSGRAAGRRPASGCGGTEPKVPPGLEDRNSRPRRSPRRLPDEVAWAIVRARVRRHHGPARVAPLRVETTGLRVGRPAARRPLPSGWATGLLFLAADDELGRRRSYLQSPQGTNHYMWTTATVLTTRCCVFGLTTTVASPTLMATRRHVVRESR